MTCRLCCSGLSFKKKRKIEFLVNLVGQRIELLVRFPMARSDKVTKLLTKFIFYTKCLGDMLAVFKIL